MEAIGTYSNTGHLREEFADLRKRVNESPSRPPLLRNDGSPSRSKRFLTADDVANIVQKYESGDTTQQIGTCCGVSKTRVATVLREQGITIRRQGLTSEQVSEPAKLYAAGHSLAWLGARYGVSHTTVATALRRQGIQLRPRPALSLAAPWRLANCTSAAICCATGVQRGLMTTLFVGVGFAVCRLSDMPLNNGEVFAGYIIQRLLGTGGMGEVYLAQHPRLPRHDALKILSSASTADEEFRARFIREAELAATLWHPHIVGVLDRGEFNGRLWISMDYVDGTDAGRLVRERYPDGMPEQDVSEIVTAVADALDFGHDRRLLHRDVKPENILVTASDGHRRRVLLTDFGIARRIDDVSNLTDANVAMGTISYVAPEQLLGKPLDGRADQYALAATTFHLLTGAPPFQDSNRAVVVSHHLSTPPPRISEPTRSRAPRRRAGKGAGQRPQRAIPELRRLCPSPHAAGSQPRGGSTASAIRLADVGVGPRRGPRFRRTSTHTTS